MKQIGGLRKVKLRGLAKVEWLFVFTCARLQPAPNSEAEGRVCVTRGPDALRGGSDRRQQGIRRQNIH